MFRSIVALGIKRNIVHYVIWDLYAPLPTHSDAAGPRIELLRASIW